MGGSLFANERLDRQIEINNNNLTGPLITKGEIEKAIKIKNKQSNRFSAIGTTKAVG